MYPREVQLRGVGQELVEPLARRMKLQPVARVRGDERATSTVLLHPQVPHFGPCERRDEVVLVQREPEVVDARQLPLAGLDDDVHGPALELGQTELEAHPVEVLPAVPGLE